MKRSIIIEIMLLFIFGFLIVVNVGYWSNIATQINYLSKEIYSSMKPYLYENINKILPYAITALIAILVNLAAIILIAIKDFPVFKPLIEKLTSRKQKRATAKAERAEEAKQAKIQALEAELEKLKKD